MKNRIYNLLMILLLAVVPVHADMLDDASAAYNKGDYNKAISLYKEAERRHGTSSALYFNMGQAYTRAGNMGAAMVSYQRALRLDPSNSEARDNIKYVESKVQDANRAEMKGKKLSVTPEAPSFFSAVKQYVTRRHASDTWALWAGICFVLFCGCVALYVFTRIVLLRKIGFFGGGAFIVLSLLFLTFAFMGAKAADRHEEGVVTAYKVQLMADPSTSSKSVAPMLTQGTMMDIIDVQKSEDGDVQWYKVRLNSDYVGWVQSDSFEVI